MKRENLKKRVFMFHAVAAVLLIVVGVQSVSFAKAVVDLKSTSVITGDHVRLGDIATIQGASKLQKELLNSIVLGSAPGPARDYELRQNFIIAKMKQNLINMDAILVKGPKSITVRADGNVLEGSNLVELAKEYVLEQTGWSKDEVGFDVSRVPSNVCLKPGKVEIDIWKVSNDFYGLTYFRTDIKVDSSSVASVPLVMKISRYVDVLVASRELERGQVLGKDDFHLVRRNISKESSRMRRHYCRPDRDITGKKTKTIVGSGRILTHDMLNDPPVVERGDPVTIEVQHGGVHISAQGVARGSALVGETVAVRSPGSRKSIMARVVRPGIVVVE